MSVLIRSVATFDLLFYFFPRVSSRRGGTAEKCLFRSAFLQKFFKIIERRWIVSNMYFGCKSVSYHVLLL